MWTCGLRYKHPQVRQTRISANQMIHESPDPLLRHPELNNMWMYRGGLRAPSKVLKSEASPPSSFSLFFPVALLLFAVFAAG